MLTFEIPANLCCDGETAGARPRCPFLRGEIQGYFFLCRASAHATAEAGHGLWISEDGWPRRRTDGRCALEEGAVGMTLEAKHGA